MLKVTVKETPKKGHWEVGTIRMSDCSETIIMILDNDGNKDIKFVYLKSKLGSFGRVCSNHKQIISQSCPIVVENAELIIGGTKND